MDSLPAPNDESSEHPADAESAEKTTPYAEPKAPTPIEPHWESVIAAATD